MVEITLLAHAQAQVGAEFVYLGGAPVCRTCPYRHACLTLDVGRKYVVAKVRPIQHPCALQESSANVVEVAVAPRPLVVESMSAVVGGQVEAGRYPCNRLDCSNWQICAGPSLPAKQRFKVQSVDPGPAECLIGRDLKRVEAV